ncbi:MAG: ABC transporter permease, partial [bacterium]
MHTRARLLWEAASLAVQSILSHKLRAFLTLLGIIIGVASVMVVGASIEGLESYVQSTVTEVLGSNSFI